MILKRNLRNGAIWGVGFAIYVASNGLTYKSLYKTKASRTALAVTFGNNRTMNALFGPSPGMDTVAGFTYFKASMTILVIAGIWGLLSSTKYLRGEEDAGRWDLMLAGHSTPLRQTVKVIGSVLAGIIPIVLFMTIGTVVGTDASLLLAFWFALTAGLMMAMFVSIGALVSQLGSTRRQATLIASAILVVAYLLRTVAESGIGLSWLDWLSPFGWMDYVNPMVSPNPVWFTPAIGLTLLGIAAVIAIAGNRDAGAGLLRSHDRHNQRRVFISDPRTLALRLSVISFLSWALGVVVYSLIVGSIAKSASKSLPIDSISKILDKTSGSSSVTAPSPGNAAASSSHEVLMSFYALGLVASSIFIAVAAAGFLTSIRQEESEGRLHQALSGRISRTGWLASRALSALAMIAMLGFLAAVSLWAGANATGVRLGFGPMVSAGLVDVAPAAIAIGFGLMLFGFVPRIASTATYSLVAVWILIEALEGIGGWGHWMADLSAFHQLAAAPYQPINVVPAIAMFGIALVAGVAGVASFSKRDLVGD